MVGLQPPAAAAAAQVAAPRTLRGRPAPQRLHPAPPGALPCTSPLPCPPWRTHLSVPSAPRPTCPAPVRVPHRPTPFLTPPPLRPSEAPSSPQHRLRRYLGTQAADSRTPPPNPSPSLHSAPPGAHLGLSRGPVTAQDGRAACWTRRRHSRHPQGAPHGHTRVSTTGRTSSAAWPSALQRPPAPSPGRTW